MVNQKAALAFYTIADLRWTYFFMVGLWISFDNILKLRKIIRQLISVSIAHS